MKSYSRLMLTAAFMSIPLSAVQARNRIIVLIAGVKSHEPGEHEYLKSIRLLKVMLDRAPNLHHVDTRIYFGGWPDDPVVLREADTVAFFSDGNDGHAEAPFMTAERMALLEQEMKRGCGFVTFHFSTFSTQVFAPQILRWAGGYFDWETGNGEGGFYGSKPKIEDRLMTWHSKIRTMETNIALPSSNHPILSGVVPFHLEDEYYYQLRFSDPAHGHVVPLMEVPALSPNPMDATVGWALERQSGGRGFGTTTGHRFANWRDDSYRKLILNALIWTSGGKVPRGGVQSRYADETEVEQYLAKHP